MAGFETWAPHQGGAGSVLAAIRVERRQEGALAGSAWLLLAVAHRSRLAYAPATEVRLFRPKPVATWEWKSLTTSTKVADELPHSAPLQMVGLAREQTGPRGRASLKLNVQGARRGRCFQHHPLCLALTFFLRGMNQLSSPRHARACVVYKYVLSGGAGVIVCMHRCVHLCGV